MKSFLAKFIALFTRNWGLKILALVLAIVIYYSLEPSETHVIRILEPQHDTTLPQSR